MYPIAKMDLTKSTLFSQIFKLKKVKCFCFSILPQGLRYAHFFIVCLLSQLDAIVKYRKSQPQPKLTNLEAHYFLKKLKFKKIK